MPEGDALRGDLAEDEKEERHRRNRGESAPAGEGPYEDFVAERRDGEVDQRVADDQRREEHRGVADHSCDQLVRPGIAGADSRTLRVREGEEYRLRARKERREAAEEREDCQFDRHVRSA